MKVVFVLLLSYCYLVALAVQSILLFFHDGMIITFFVIDNVFEYLKLP